LFYNGGCEFNAHFIVQRAAVEYACDLEQNMFLKTRIQSYGLWDIGRRRRSYLCVLLNINASQDRLFVKKN